MAPRPRLCGSADRHALRQQGPERRTARERILREGCRRGRSHEQTAPFGAVSPARCRNVERLSFRVDASLELRREADGTGQRRLPRDIGCGCGDGECGVGLGRRLREWGKCVGVRCERRRCGASRNGRFAAMLRCGCGCGDGECGVERGRYGASRDGRVAAMLWCGAALRSSYGRRCDGEPVGYRASADGRARVGNWPGRAI
jgi:hypothetical protein